MSRRQLLLFMAIYFPLIYLYKLFISLKSQLWNISLCVCVYVCVCVCEGCSVMSSPLQPHGLYSPWHSPGQNTGVGSLSLLQGIFPTQGSNPGLPNCRQVLYQLSHQGSPRILEPVAYPFSSRSSRLRDRIRVSCIAGGLFTNWATREVCVCVCVFRLIFHVCVCIYIYIHIFLCPVKEQLLTWLQVLGLSWRAGQMQTCPVFRYSFQLPALCLLLFSLTLKGFLPFTARLGNLSFWSLSLTWTLASGVRLQNVVGHGTHNWPFLMGPWAMAPRCHHQSVMSLPRISTL